MLVELQTIISEHEVIIKQTAGKEISFVMIPKKTAVDFAREILKAYPEETISQILEEIKSKARK